ncbi:peptidoglycan bridge formation glycyltransferase FemA/FemB family protein [Bacteriovoracales bacterium]|nr:peptidoglycan bridge formation glycyltransferase FemA/FemB family protein [Bacteriovoracales bacterium]
MPEIDCSKNIEKKQWNENLSRCKNPSFFSLYEWGEFKSDRWTPLRLSFSKNSKFIGCTQILMKKKFGTKFGWASGGINYTDSKYLKEIIDNIQEKFKGIFNIRFNFTETLSGRLSFNISQIKPLKKAISSINSGFTIISDLKSAPDFLSTMSKNNRYYYKKSLKEGLRFEAEEELRPGSFIQLHNEMVQLKNIKDIKCSLGEIERLKKFLEGGVKQYSVFHQEKRISTCLILQTKNTAFYYLAATNEKGRDLFASFFMVFNLLNSLKSQDVKYFDFGGITPYKESAKGVNRFKIGFGGEIKKSLGEFDLSPFNWSRKVFNTVLSP